VELARLVLNSPRVGLNFGGIFDEGRGFDEDSEDGDEEGGGEKEPVSPSTKRRLLLERKGHEREKEREKENFSPQPSPSAPPTRLRKPSIRASLPRPSLPPSTTSCPTTFPTTARTDHPQPLAPASVPAPAYDLEDEDNLPSPFLKRIDRGRPHSRRGSGAYDLRAKAAANVAMGSGKEGRGARISAGASVGAGAGIARPSLERAKQASEDAKKALFRP
jgi:hypothetical protein